MGSHLDPLKCLNLLSCPCPREAALTASETEAICSGCERRFPVRGGILEFVNPDDLEVAKAKELRGQTIELTPSNIQRMVNKDTWSTFRAHSADQKFKQLARYLADTDSRTLISLGSGVGFEIKGLLPLHSFDRVLSSDLSYSKLCVVPHTLERFGVEILRFTSDLDACPVRDRDLPILVYEALHHTPDMHATLTRLMERGHEHLLLVEPATNGLMRALERWGLSRRIEYSGVKPGRLEVSRVRELCSEHGYTSEITTMWVFPDDYLKSITRSGGMPQRLFLLAVDLLSIVTRPFGFGNFAIVSLQRSRI